MTPSTQVVRDGAGCVSMGDAGMLCSGPGFLFRRVLRCRSERRLRRHVVRDDVWYGATVTCCACGYEHEAGYLGRRQSKKRRGEKAAQARSLWPRIAPAAQVWEAYYQYIGVGEDSP